MNLIKDFETLHKLSSGEHSLEEVLASATVDGEVFMCSSHGLDYRIACEECQKKSKMFIRVCEAIMLK